MGNKTKYSYQMQNRILVSDKEDVHGVCKMFVYLRHILRNFLPCEKIIHIVLATFITK